MPQKLQGLPAFQKESDSSDPEEIPLVIKPKQFPTYKKKSPEKNRKSPETDSWHFCQKCQSAWYKMNNRNFFTVVHESFI